MSKIATFENTVGILAKAYLNDTLIHLDCAACAVGNILAAKCNLEYLSKNTWIDTNGQAQQTLWYNAVRNMRSGIELKPGSLEEIAKTGYSLKQVEAIEWAFEHPSSLHNDNILGGLLAVVDVLAEIHGIDLATAEASKLLFVKA